MFSGLAAGCWSRLLFSGRAAGCYSWLCSSAGLGRVSLHCHLAQAPAVPHITHPRATLSKQPQYKKHGKTFEKQPGAPSGPEKFVPKLWKPFSNKLQQHLDHFRTTSNLQFPLLCWDIEPCSNRFEPVSNRMVSAIPITMLGFRTVFEQIRTGFEPHGICNSYYYAGMSTCGQTTFELISNRFRTTSNLQFLLLCWDFEPCSNRFEPGSNRMDSAIPIKLLGFRTVFEPRSNRVRTAFEPPGNAIPIKLVGFRTGLTKRGVGTFKILKPQPPPPGRTEAPRILVQLFSEPPATKRLPVFWNNFSGPVACFWVLPPFRVVFFIPVALLFFSGCRRFGTTFPAP